MRPSFSVVAQHVSRSAPTLLPIGLLAVSTFSAAAIPIRHSLFANAVAWSLVWIYYGVRVGFWQTGPSRRRRRLSWVAGALFALAQICERAAWEKEGSWWAKSLLPIAVYVILRSFFERDQSSTPPIDYQPGHVDGLRARGLGRLLLTITVVAAFALKTAALTSPNAALGLCGALLTSCALVLLDYNLGLGADDKKDSANPMSPIGGFAHGGPGASAMNNEMARLILRDVAVVVAASCALGSFRMESFRGDYLTYQYSFGGVFNTSGNTWKERQHNWNMWGDVLSAVVEMIRAALLLSMTRYRGALQVALILSASVILARLTAGCTLWEVWFAILYSVAGLVALDELEATSILATSRKRMRARQITTAVAIASLVALGLFTLSNSRFANRGADFAFPFPAEPPTETLSPLRVGSTRSHPIDFLVRSAEKEFSEKLDKQSKSLDEAVAEYRRRYRVPPPPHFDVWYQFAKNKDVQLVDEFDSIYHSLLPFWGLDPSVIRARTKEALGGNNVLVGISIRDGQTVRAEGGQEWFQKALLGMMKNFMHNLPDMDLAFNTHDEPRVIVPHDHLTQLLELAQNRQMVAAVYPNGHRNQFSSRPKDMGAGTSIPEVKTTRFNRFAHQPVWTHSRISCPANSPARNFEEVSTDNVTSYAYSDLGFVYNQTAFSDICMSPSLRETYGFFDRPNAFDVTHDLFPIFSQSKISSFQDILYPSPWYWDGKVAYDETKDMEWDAKEARLYWRGSTTGGFSRDGGWRRQHRQRAVRIVNANDEAQILRNRGPAADSDTQTNEPDWQPDTVKRADYASIFDVKFSHVGQCDKHDCDAQREYFDVAERADQQDAWGYKYLLDMDGNAFSGRFYAFLKSNSLVYKMSVFREWHADWLAPWVHYIPLSLKGGDWLEVVRYFAGEEEGKVQGPRLAWQGREWAGKALRNEDFEVWFFRLLLEYGRLIDDNRETIGYPGP